MSSDKALWLKRLGALDQHDAPDLPPHVSLNDLTSEELRTLVERAQRRYRNSTDPAPLRPTRKTTIRIKPAIDESRDSLSVLTAKAEQLTVRPVDTELLPGGALLLVHLEDDLQCWTVPGGERVWSHRDDGPYETKGMKVLRFAYDMQTNGDVHVLVVTESFDELVRERTVTIFTISPHEKSACQSDTSLLCRTLKSFWKKPTSLLYKYTPKELEKTYIYYIVGFAKLSGDILAVSVGNDLLVTFWEEKRSVLIPGCSCHDVHFVDGYLIGVFCLQLNWSIIAFRLSSIRNVRLRASASGATQISTLEGDIPHASCLGPRRNVKTLPDTARLSICTFHWKSEADRKRKGVSITMLAEPEICPVLYSFLLEFPAVTVGPNARLPSITHVERPGTTTFDPHFHKYTDRPSQAGSVLMHSSDTGVDRREDVWVFATISSKGKLEHRTLSMPHADIAKVEFYSGALYFVTQGSVVIQYLD
ncbi:hypothetical protein DFH11DRAFT_1723711 [Phellopilus nigrolimitatus]|nr:hypothetical protein DFH11DRAFT_1723711 [Phellopilus nigrolimitatus]